MKLEAFTDDIPGKLVDVQIPNEKGFLPDLLPVDWEFPEELWPLLSDAKETLGRLDGIGRTLDNPELLLHPLQRREAIRSSSLEGTYSTPQELLLFELDSESAQKGKKAASNNALEVSNYKRSLREGYNFLVKGGELTLAMIRQLHKWLTDGVRGQHKNPGEFRTTQVHIGSDKRYIPPPPQYLTDLLENLEGHLKEPDSRFDPLVYCYIIHYQFERIHPFIDGNGRIGRVLLSLMIYKYKNLKMPWLYMSPYFEEYKDEYIRNLFNVSAKGDWTEWIRFCLRGTIEQCQDAIYRCELLGKLKNKYLTEATEGSGRIANIIKELFTIPLISITKVRDMMEVTYPTAKGDVEYLESLGILKEVENTRPKMYIAPEILHIAFNKQLSYVSDENAEE